MSAYPVVDDLQLFSGVHVKAGHVGHPARDARDGFRLGVAQPRRLADAVVRGDQFTGLRVVDYGTLELGQKLILNC